MEFAFACMNLDGAELQWNKGKEVRNYGKYETRSHFNNSELET